MVGFVLAELIRLVEVELGKDIAEQMIARAAIAAESQDSQEDSGKFGDVTRLLESLSQQTGLSSQQLARLLGRHLFHKFVMDHANLFENIGNVFDLLLHAAESIYQDIRQQYPDVDLPEFNLRPVDGGSMEITFGATRMLADLAEGMLSAAIDHYDESLGLIRIEQASQDDLVTLFLIQPLGK